MKVFSLESLKTQPFAQVIDASKLDLYWSIDFNGVSTRLG